MKDAPKDLIDKIVNLPDKWKAAKYAAAAYEVILYYTGISVHESMFSAFPLNLKAPTEIRLTWLAASLFALKDDPIMPELCKRLNERDMRSTYFEISAACFCKEIGYSVCPSPGLSKKGSDFDFTINIEPLLFIGPLSSRETINVEVTELQSPLFDVKGVVSSLNRKRRQLPTDSANMIFCHYPFQWGETNSDFKYRLNQVSEKFFRGSKRVNVIQFAREFWVEGKDVYQIHYSSFVSQNIRYRADRLQIALNNYLRDLPKTSEGALLNPANQRNYPTFRMRDFEAWVDSVLPSPHIK